MISTATMLVPRLMRAAPPKGVKLYYDSKTGITYYKELWFVAAGDGFRPVVKRIIVKQEITFEEEVIKGSSGIGVDDPNAKVEQLPGPLVNDPKGLDSAKKSIAKNDPDVAIDPDASTDTYRFGSAGSSAAAQAFGYGILAAAAGLPEQSARIDALSQEIEQLQQSIAFQAQANAEAGGAVLAALAMRGQALDAALAGMSDLPVIRAADPHLAAANGKTLFATQDPYLALRLKRMADSMIAAPANLMPTALRDAGIAAVRQADVESALGNDEDAVLFARVARIVADVGIGIDPVTGVARGLYELVTGVNLVTGKSLEPLEHGFAAVNVMLLGGFGTAKAAVSGIAKLGRIIGGTRGKAIIKTVTEIASKWPTKTIDRILQWRASGVATIESETVALATTKAIVPVGSVSGVYAKVMEAKYADKLISGGQLSGDTVAFITDVESIAGITKREALAQRLGLLDPKDLSKLRSLEDHVVVEFRFASNEPLAFLASPFGEVGKLGPGFLPGGRTFGGAAEWVIDSNATGKGLIDLSTIKIRNIPHP